MSGRTRRTPRAHRALAALVLLALPAHAEAPLVVEAQLAPLTTTDAGQPVYAVGAPFRLVVEAKHAPGAIAMLPEALALGDQLGERREARRHLRRDEAGSQVDRYELELIPFESGTLTIPAIPLAFGSTTADTQPIEVEIESSLDDDARPVAASTRAEALAELERLAATNPPPRVIEIPDHRPLYALGALVALIVLALIVRHLRRREVAGSAGPPPPPPRPAHELALERLAALERQSREPGPAQKAYYVELSEIVRAYVGGRYGFDSVELTVAELLAALEARPTPGLDRAVLRRVLDTADLVKFAKLTTDEAEATAHARSAVQLVEATRVRPAPEVPA